MRICPTCRTVYPDSGAPTCVRDGGKLVDSRKFAEAEADPLRGVVVAKRFRIIERIAVGGMGTVYRAEQLGLARSVALKILKRELAWERDTVTRFHREAKAMSLLVHANTVRVFDFGETDDGLLFLAMEMLEGDLLTEKLQREGPLDVSEAIGLTRQILGSLAEAHKKGIVHRDLKPDNIFLARIEGHAPPVIKVLDFGIAKIVQGDRKLDQLETQAGTVFGTPRYMSPEQAQGKRLDPRSDLYSVGVIFYQMLTGRPPFTDDDAVVVMAKHIRERPRRPREAAPSRPIPPSVDRLAMKAVEKDPNKRFASAEEFEAKLGSLLPDVEAWAKALREGRKPRVPKTAIAIGAAMIFGAIALSGYLIASAGSTDGGHTTRLPRMENAPPSYINPMAVVRIDSEPEGAWVYRDGRFIGIAPVAVPVQRGGIARIEARREGFETATTMLPGVDAAHTLTLVPSPVRPVAPTTSDSLVHVVSAHRPPVNATRPRVPPPVVSPPPQAAHPSPGSPYARFE